MRPSPLHLDNYFVKATYFALNPGFDREREFDADIVPPDFKVSADFERPKDTPDKCRCELEVELPKDPAKKFPYIFGVKLVGVYTIQDGLPDELAEAVIRANAPALLYSSARELVIALTGRGGYPPFLLPSVTFAFDEKSVKGSKHRLTAKGSAAHKRATKKTTKK